MPVNIRKIAARLLLDEEKVEDPHVEDPQVAEHRASVNDMMAWNSPASVTPMSNTPVSSGAVDPLLDDSFAEFTPAAGVPIQKGPVRETIEPATESPATDTPATIDDALWAPQAADSLPAEAAEEPAEQVAEETPGAFVTETMAELYVRQGLIEHAVGVYQQLVEQSPDDMRLRARLHQLEGRPPADVVPDDLGLTRETQSPVTTTPEERGAQGPSMREVLARIAATRLGDGAHAWSEPAVEPMAEASVEETPVAEPTPPVTSWEAPPEFESEPAAVAEAPPSQPQGESRQPDALATLFGNRGVRVEDEAAALSLSALYANGDSSAPAVIGGKPTRAASDEFSLDRVFADAPRRSAEVRRSQNFSFDQFFSDGSGTASQSTAPPSAAEPREADIVQFNSWLEGLKKK